MNLCSAVVLKYWYIFLAKNFVWTVEAVVEKAAEAQPILPLANSDLELCGTTDSVCLAVWRPRSSVFWCAIRLRISRSKASRVSTTPTLLANSFCTCSLMYVVLSCVFYYWVLMLLINTHGDCDCDRCYNSSDFVFVFLIRKSLVW